MLNLLLNILTRTQNAHTNWQGEQTKINDIFKAAKEGKCHSSRAFKFQSISILATRNKTDISSFLAITKPLFCGLH